MRTSAGWEPGLSHDLLIHPFGNEGPAPLNKTKKQTRDGALETLEVLGRGLYICIYTHMHIYVCRSSARIHQLYLNAPWGGRLVMGDTQKAF